MNPTNIHGEPVFVSVAVDDDMHVVILDPEVTSFGWAEPAAICLACDYESDSLEGDCQRLAMHEGQHAYLDGDQLIAFNECACWKIDPDRRCWHTPAAANDISIQLAVDASALDFVETSQE